MLCLNNIAKKYKDKIALEHVSLELDTGIWSAWSKWSGKVHTHEHNNRKYQAK